MSRQRVLVVGGAGYIGSVLVHKLLQKNYDVRVLDRLFFGAESLADVAEQVELVVADMRDVSAAVMDGIDAVVNLGGLSNDPTADFDPVANHEMNTVASVRIAEMAAEAGVERLLFASSCSIYDRGVLDEERDILLNETAEVSPSAHYALSKLEAEKGILPLTSPTFAPLVFRMGTLYGASHRMRFDLVVNSFVRDALTRGEVRLFYGGAMWRPLVGIRDVANGYLAALAAPAEDIRGQVVNLSGYNVRISELALRVRARLARLDVPADIVLDNSQAGVRSYRVSAHKARAILGWRPQQGIEEAVGEIVIRAREAGDLNHPRYSNIAWMQLLEGVMATAGQGGYVLRRAHEPAEAH